MHSKTIFLVVHFICLSAASILAHDGLDRPWHFKNNNQEVNLTNKQHTKTNTDGPVVNTNYGAVQGVYLEEDNMEAFFGIPFAAPPIGPLRWEPPHPPERWQLYRADRQPAACPQQNSDPPDEWPFYVCIIIIFVVIFR